MEKKKKTQKNNNTSKKTDHDYLQNEITKHNKISTSRTNAIRRMIRIFNMLNVGSIWKKKNGNLVFTVLFLFCLPLYLYLLNFYFIEKVYSIYSMYYLRQKCFVDVIVKFTINYTFFDCVIVQINLYVCFNFLVICEVCP